jgi:hypothetical protein
MRRALIALVSIGFCVFVSSTMMARQLPSIAWDYLQLSPDFGQQSRVVYSACVASPEGWECRKFEDPESVAESGRGTADTALRKALATLGSEGWEMVSVVQGRNPQLGMTYLFKRPQR